MPYKGSDQYHGPARELVTEATGNGNDLTIGQDTQVVYGDTNDSTQTITIPADAEADGKEVTVQDAGGNASTNAITVSAGSGANVDGSDQDLTITSNYGSLTLTYSADETGWFSQ